MGAGSGAGGGAGGGAAHARLEFNASTPAPIAQVTKRIRGFVLVKALFLSDEFSDPENVSCVLVQRKCSPNRIGGHGEPFPFELSFRGQHTLPPNYVARAGSIPTTEVTQVFGHMGDTSWHLGAFPKCPGKKPSPPLARSGSRDFPEEEFSPSLREVPLVWGVH